FTIERLETRLQRIADFLRGLDFYSGIKPEQVGLDPKNSFSSVPSGNRYLRAVLNSLAITEDDQIIDIGCGKGSAMRLFLAFPFGRVDGVELSKEIAEIARRNFSILNTGRTTVYTGDATAFEDLDKYNYIYFYNPFPALVMKIVVQNIKASLQRNPRKLVIIYDNPTCNDEVLKIDSIKVVSNYLDINKNHIFVYST
ncbi:MAG TPA: methyltransferase domain-containing protein, partial [Pseudomonadales bacterium]|nr:methyltransferase domain-containing protein [Pseudomonadales bacterium]